jgi:hypothetical protein
MRTWAQRSRDVSFVQQGTLKRHGCRSIVELADEHPDEFDLLYQALADLEAEAPPVIRPRFAQ